LGILLCKITNVQKKNQNGDVSVVVSRLPDICVCRIFASHIFFSSLVFFYVLSGLKTETNGYTQLEWHHNLVHVIARLNIGGECCPGMRFFLLGRSNIHNGIRPSSSGPRSRRYKQKPTLCRFLQFIHCLQLQKRTQCGIYSY